MLFRRRQVLAVLGGLIVVVVTMVVTLRERTVFVSKCAMNNNAFADCWCTFNALSDLSPNYRHLATSWAHDTGVTLCMSSEQRR